MNPISLINQTLKPLVLRTLSIMSADLLLRAAERIIRRLWEG